MIINTVLLDKKRYKLVDEDYSEDKNVFTIIVGSNGMGKSRILKRIVNNLKNIDIEGEKIPKNYSKQITFDSYGHKTNFYSCATESKSYISDDKIEIKKINENIKVLAVTTTPFDKFPVEYKGNQIYRYHDNQRYTYIGLKVSKNSLNQSNYLNLLARSMLMSDNISNNKKLFQLLKLNSDYKIQFKSKLPSKDSDLMEYISQKRRFIKKELTKKLFINLLESRYTTIHNLVKSKINFSKIYDAYMKCFPYLSQALNPRDEDVPREELLYLLDLGLINAVDFIFCESNGNYIKISDLSSGQKCMILTLLNIAGSISNNSVVCIDEPEISLHPKWQREFMRVLIDFFSDYKRCHFIIATHSPLIISELSESNCYILNMDFGHAKKAEEYKSMSSDYQLVEVFGISGHNNEYLNRIVVSLLSKLSLTADLDKDDIKKLNVLVKLSKEMDDEDRVKQLIDILYLAWRKVMKNAK
ncbi:AAA family ATPase [Shewanella seohaensis]|uniref:AAA family ATPase n=1 Tax=Shewanella seohaensis TaxID=755175 RepID=A0ABV4VWW0_9GAMM